LKARFKKERSRKVSERTKGGGRGETVSGKGSGYRGDRKGKKRIRLSYTKVKINYVVEAHYLVNY